MKPNSKIIFRIKR